MLEKKVEAFLREKNFKLQNQRILTGVSGGPDSLALLHFLWSREDEWQIKIYAAHLDHMFRGRESEEDALFVKNFCEKRNIPVEIRKINVPKYMEETGLSAQTAARQQRYRFFSEILVKYDIPLLALAHHGDDQIETILMRLTRGSTGRARAGIPFERDFEGARIFRPFLCVNREEIEEYCSRHGLKPRLDPSNEKDVYSRNRFRKVVLPFLRKENPRVHEHFQRFSEELESDELFLQELANKELQKAVKDKTKKTVKVDITAFLKMSIPLQRRGIQLILKYLYKTVPASLSAIHIDQVLSLMNSPHPSGSLDFPGDLKIVRSYKELYFRYQVPDKEEKSFFFEISEPGEILLPNGDILRMEFIEDTSRTADKYSFVFQIDKTRLPLIVRTRRDGDRMAVKGLKGTKKLKDIFIDEKIPLHKRNSWPVITDRYNEILWLPGIRKASMPPINDHDGKITIYLVFKVKTSRGNSNEK